MSDDRLITSAKEVARVADAIAARGSFALDLEFVSEDRYVPELALVQVAWGETEQPELAALDPLAIDPRPIFELVGDERVETVVHGGKQDLGLLSHRYQIQAAGLADTQIAAALAGIADQIGYGRMIERLVGVGIDKGHQYTDWLRRPLSAKQLRYALDDVRYLPRAWQILADKLSALGRLEWAREESQLLASEAATRPGPEVAYLKIGGWKGLRAEALGAMRALAAWREREALDSNRPPSWILPDGALVELCRRGINSTRDLRSVRGVGQGTVERYGQAIVQVLEEGRGSPAEVAAPRAQLDQVQQAQTLVLAGLVLGRSAEVDISPRLLGSRADAEELVRWNRDRTGALPRLMRGWRAEVIGNDAAAWLSGQLAVFYDRAAGITRTEPRSSGE